MSFINYLHINISSLIFELFSIICFDSFSPLGLEARLEGQETCQETSRKTPLLLLPKLNSSDSLMSNTSSPGDLLCLFTCCYFDHTREKFTRCPTNRFSIHLCVLSMKIPLKTN